MLLAGIHNNGTPPRLAPKQVATAESQPYDLSVEQAPTEATLTAIRETSAETNLFKAASRSSYRHQVEIDYVEDTQPVPVTRI